MSYLSPNFSTFELQCKGSGKLILHPGFMQELQHLRDRLGRAMIITSGCRSFEYNTHVGGHPRSLHICDRASHPGQQGTLAVDIAAVDGKYRGDLFTAAWELGWSVGWNAKRNFLHLDRRDMVGLAQSSFDY
jgi:hypothetical protein